MKLAYISILSFFILNIFSIGYITSQEPYEKQLNKIETKLNNGDIEKSFELMINLLSKYPENPELHYRASQIYFQYKEKYAESIDQINFAIKLNSKSEYFLHRAHIYKSMSDYQNAIEGYLAVIKYNPNDKKANLEISECYIALLESSNASYFLENIQNEIYNSLAGSSDIAKYENLIFKLKYIEDSLWSAKFINAISSDINKYNDKKVNYKLLRKEVIGANEWVAIFNTLNAGDFAVDNSKSTFSSNPTIPIIDFIGKSDFYVNANNNSNFFTVGNFSNSVEVFNRKKRSYIGKLNLPNSDCSIAGIFNNFLFITYSDNSDNLFIAKYDLNNMQLIFKAQIGKGRRDILCMYMDERIKVLTRKGILYVLNQKGGIISDESILDDFKFQFGYLEKGNIHFLKGGNQLCAVTRSGDLVLLNESGKTLQYSKFDYRKLFMTSEAYVKIENVFLHPSNEYLFFVTEYGIFIWDFLSNSISILDDFFNADFPKNKYYSRYRGVSHSKPGFADNGRYLIVFMLIDNKSPGYRYIYELTDDKSNNQLHRNFLNEVTNQYTGESKDGLPHGRGKMVYSNRDVYEGEFKNGQRDGFGKYYYNYGDGYLYDGHWRNGKRDGYGVMYMTEVEDLSQSERYDCTWKNDRKDGEGFYINYNYLGKRDTDGKYQVSYIFKGSWKDDKRHGSAMIYTTKKLFIDGTIHSYYVYDVEYKDGEVMQKSLIEENSYLKNFLKSISEQEIDQPNVQGVGSCVKNTYQGTDVRYLNKSCEQEQYKMLNVECRDGKQFGLFFQYDDISCGIYWRDRGYYSFKPNLINWEGTLTYQGKSLDEALNNLCKCQH